MKFGHVVTEDLDQLDLSLPQDFSANSTVLQSGKSGQCEIILGCAKWGISEWKGKVYPEKTKVKDFLPAYINAFNGVEVNNTFYRLSRSAIEDWAETAAQHNFVYCPKWSRRVSHLKRLKEDADENVEYFRESCKLFGKSLGTTFLQMPENYAPKYIDRLIRFCNGINGEFPVHVELRHKEWFAEETLSELRPHLEKNKIGLCITDTAGRRDAVHMQLHIPEVFVRFIGYDLHQSDYDRLDEWAEQIKLWSDQGLEKCYFFCHQDDESYTPIIAQYFAEKMNSMGWNLKLPLISD